MNHVQLHHSPSHDGRLILAQIDVVTESEFPKLIEKILAELKILSARIKDHYPRLLNSAIDQHQVASLNAARSMFSSVAR